MSRAYSDLIEELDCGQTNTDATRQLSEVIDALNAAAQRTGKAKGSLTLTLSFEAASNGRIEIESAIKAKLPAPPKARETRWVGDGGALLNADPRQETLPLRSAATPRYAPDLPTREASDEDIDRARVTGPLEPPTPPPVPSAPRPLRSVKRTDKTEH
jgi:hypothetical protein